MGKLFKTRVSGCRFEKLKIIRSRRTNISNNKWRAYVSVNDLNSEKNNTEENKQTSSLASEKTVHVERCQSSAKGVQSVCVRSTLLSLLVWATGSSVHKLLKFIVKQKKKNLTISTSFFYVQYAQKMNYVWGNDNGGETHIFAMP